MVSQLKLIKNVNTNTLNLVIISPFVKFTILSAVIDQFIFKTNKFHTFLFKYNVIQ